MSAIHQFVHFGFDIGSISINTVVMDDDRNILENRYDLCHGRPFEQLLRILKELEIKYPPGRVRLIGLTGTGGKLAHTLIGGHY
ncbi:MAG: hypothetical protein ACOCWA_08775, partial [Bacteroidota bacterium]